MKFRYLFIFTILIFSFVITKLAFASSTSGYAWSENTGWIDFSQVTVSDTALSGYAYSSNIGWISLNCENTSSCGTVDYKVSNSLGTLSGYAWSENTGWIDFSQVTINTGTGVFSGYAYSSNIGWISLNCENTSSCGTVDYKVTTAWRYSPPTASQNRSGSVISRPQTVPPVISPNIQAKCQLNIVQNIKLSKPLMKNENIKSLQSCLNTKVPGTSLVVDGVYGPKTRQVVMLFQKIRNLTIDGIVGPITRSELIK